LRRKGLHIPDRSRRKTQGVGGKKGRKTLGKKNCSFPFVAIGLRDGGRDEPGLLGKKRESSHTEGKKNPPSSEGKNGLVIDFRNRFCRPEKERIDMGTDCEGL